MPSEQPPAALEEEPVAPLLGAPAATGAAPEALSWALPEVAAPNAPLEARSAYGGAHSFCGAGWDVGPQFPDVGPPSSDAGSAQAMFEMACGTSLHVQPEGQSPSAVHAIGGRRAVRRRERGRRAHRRGRGLDGAAVGGRAAAAAGAGADGVGIRT